MKLLPMAALIVLALTIPAFAQDADTSITIPWGDWLAAILGQVAASISVILLAVLTWLSTKLPPAVQAFITTERIKQVEQILERAITYGLQQAATGVKGKTANVDVKNEAVETALQYVIDHGPAKLIAWMGGIDAIREKIIARLPTT